MEHTLVFLLLLCSFSSAHDSSEEELHDLRTVLREMTAALAEHKVKIEHLQAFNKEQATKEKQSCEVGPLKEQLQKQAAKLEELEKQSSEVEEMKEQLQAKFEELEKKSSEVEKMTEHLQGETNHDRPRVANPKAFMGQSRDINIDLTGAQQRCPGGILNRARATSADSSGHGLSSSPYL
ncbi:hypothetical protein WMY93_026919 [Mugilogobius chulae]|uniref:Uncharacterized protein n=1 Tax=Mugilogobius chulae TaxID=88201 RepID=A0AAW0MUT7_9GOBI